MTDIVERLRGACDGHPHAKIEWPHRVLHEAAAEIVRLRAALTEITNQKTASEIYEECGDDFSGDFEYGYDALIRIARAALTSTDSGPTGNIEGGA